jgi:hypothetical protein
MERHVSCFFSSLIGRELERQFYTLHLQLWDKSNGGSIGAKLIELRVCGILGLYSDVAVSS